MKVCELFDDMAFEAIDMDSFYQTIKHVGASQSERFRVFTPKWKSWMPKKLATWKRAKSK